MFPLPFNYYNVNLRYNKPHNTKEQLNIILCDAIEQGWFNGTSSEFEAHCVDLGVGCNRASCDMTQPYHDAAMPFSLLESTGWQSWILIKIRTLIALLSRMPHFLGLHYV